MSADTWNNFHKMESSPLSNNQKESDLDQENKSQDEKTSEPTLNVEENVHSQRTLERNENDISKDESKDMNHIEQEETASNEQMKDIKHEAKDEVRSEENHSNPKEQENSNEVEKLREPEPEPIVDKALEMENIIILLKVSLL